MHAPKLELRIDELVRMREVELGDLAKGPHRRLKLWRGRWLRLRFHVSLFREGGNNLAGLLHGTSHVPQECGWVGQSEVAWLQGLDLRHWGPIA